ncbi:MAG: S-layer homology domain-containing protein [Acidimicrobiales bacterium]
MPENRGLGRRAFLQGSLAVGGAFALLPTWMDEFAAAATPIGSSDRILVSVFLNGGNDALHTLIPAENSAYQAARGGIAYQLGGGANDLSAANRVGSGLYLNPRMPNLKTRFDAGEVAFVQGIGEESDDHSHFTSTATWMAGIPQMSSPTGWLGRLREARAFGEFGLVSVGAGAPLLLRGPGTSPVAMPSGGGLFGAYDLDDNADRALFQGVAAYQYAGIGPYAGTIGNAWSSAVNSANDLAVAYDNSLPGNSLSRDMAVAAELINLNVGVRVAHVQQGGYDTHAGQRPGHDNLLGDLDAAIEELFSRLDPAFAARTAVMVWSEFGRRVESNNSNGTDHGAAGLLTMVGPNVKGGLKGAAPSLTSLDNRGDLKHQVDFRQVYTSVCEQWFDVDGFDILQTHWEPLDLLDNSGFAGAGVSTSFQPGNMVFDDVPPAKYYTTAVGWLAHKGITTGTAPRRFSPFDPVTRGQMATFLWRFRQSPTPLSPSGFSDIPSGVYYEDAVSWLLESGITTGVGGNRFAPDDFVTRAQMATFLWRLEGSPPGSPAAGFGDVPAGQYYSDAVDWLLHRGITTGTGPGVYSPNDQVSRAQMATFLWRLAGEPT